MRWIAGKSADDEFEDADDSELSLPSTIMNSSLKSSFFDFSMPPAKYKLKPIELFRLVRCFVPSAIGFRF
jgi:hypothetical protein